MELARGTCAEGPREDEVLLRVVSVMELARGTCAEGPREDEVPGSSVEKNVELLWRSANRHCAPILRRRGAVTRPKTERQSGEGRPHLMAHGARPLVEAEEAEAPSGPAPTSRRSL